MTVHNNIWWRRTRTLDEAWCRHKKTMQCIQWHAKMMYRYDDVAWWCTLQWHVAAYDEETWCRWRSDTRCEARQCTAWWQTTMDVDSDDF